MSMMAVTNTLVYFVFLLTWIPPGIASGVIVDKTAEKIAFDVGNLQSRKTSCNTALGSLKKNKDTARAKVLVMYT